LNYVLNLLPILYAVHATPEAVKNDFRERGITHIYYDVLSVLELRKYWCQDVNSNECKQFEDTVAFFNQALSSLRTVRSGEGWYIFVVD
jgi:hypothetical protein